MVFSFVLNDLGGQFGFTLIKKRPNGKLFLNTFSSFYDQAQRKERYTSAPKHIQASSSRLMMYVSSFDF